MPEAKMTEGLLEDIKELARQAGREIVRVYESDFAVEHKEDKSPLTLADRRSHDLITASLAKLSSYPVLSEEGADIPREERAAWEHFWLVDPLDGTKEFIKRNGEFTVNIALMHGTMPVMGVIYAPAQETLYYAAQGCGAFIQDNQGTSRLPLVDGREDLIIVGSRSHRTPEFDAYVQEIQRRRPAVSFVSAGSSLKFCLVAEGKADLYPRLGPTMEWDTAAGQIIVQEAGGTVLDAATRRPLAYNKPVLRNNHFIAFRGKGEHYV